MIARFRLRKFHRLCGHRLGKWCDRLLDKRQIVADQETIDELVRYLTEVQVYDHAHNVYGLYILHKIDPERALEVAHMLDSEHWTETTCAVKNIIAWTDEKRA